MPRLYFSVRPDRDYDCYMITVEGDALSEANDVYFVIWQKGNKSMTEKWERPNCVNSFGTWHLNYRPCGERGCIYCLHVYKNGNQYIDETEFFVERRAGFTSYY